MWIRNTLFWSENVEGSGGEAPAPAPDTNGVSKEIADIMNFDPFDSADPAPVSPPEPEVVPTQAPEASAVPIPSVEAPAPAPDPLAQTVQGLQQTVQDLPNVIREAVKPQTPAAPEPDAWAPMVDGQPLNYMQVMSSVPDGVINALASDNPAERKQALAQTLGIAMHVAHRLATKQAVEQVRAEMGRVLPAFVNEQLQTRERMTSVFNDFYGKHPELSHPSLRGVVQQEAVKLSQQLNVRDWTPEFRDRLGEHVRNMLRGVVPATVQTQQPAAPMMGPTARPMQATGPSNVQQEIADLLF